MATELNNCSSILGDYNQTPMNLPSNCIMTLLVDVDVTKSANREVWGTGYLTYTINVVNNTGMAITNASLEDILDPTLISFVTGSLTVSVNTVPVENPTHNFNPGDGKLTVDLDDIEIDATVVIMFDVERK